MASRHQVTATENVSMRTVNFALVIHSHQPVGNFDQVFEQAYQDAYKPFLEMIGDYPEIPFTLHYSGCLLEWLGRHHPALLRRVKRLVRRGQVELLGGGFYEPIFSMLTETDIRGQVTSFADYLKRRFGARPQGIWLAERVWEQTFTRLLADLGIRYTIVDDTHFKYAGLNEEELVGYFLTEDRGRLLRIFPGSEKLRYAIPFREPEKTIAFLRGLATEDGSRLVVYADDGEKFGVWPGTHKHVYKDGWLREFLDLVSQNRDWIKLLRLGEAADSLGPAGKVYLPDASYREMCEWALPADVLTTYEDMVELVEEQKELLPLKRFIKGGYWRNFKVKYPEANLLYARMMQASRKVNGLPKSSTAYPRASRELYRGQCNCAYWHGVFGGLYLPHLRSAAYRHLIAADRLADAGTFKSSSRTRLELCDFDMDGAEEVCLCSRRLSAYLKPNQGGGLYELDLKPKGLNLLATLARRPEAYHRDLLARAQSGELTRVESIHDIRFAKQPGLEKRLLYDRYPRWSLLDHFFTPGTTLNQLVSGRHTEPGNFPGASYSLGIIGRRTSSPAVQLESAHQVLCGDEPVPIRVSKVVRLTDKGGSLSAAYQVVNRGVGKFEALFAVEFNFALLAGDSPGSFYHLGEGEPLGDLSMQGELGETDLVVLRAEVVQLDVFLKLDTPTRFWCYPIKTVSQSESGLELVYQSSVVLPFWRLELPPGERWTVQMTLGTRSL